MGTDPLAAISAQVAAADAAMLEAAINLGVSAELLQTQIATGDILAAQILPPQNGQDYIQIAGQRVAAQLPPGVNPGQTLLLQVTGFAGTQIYVRNLGTQDPSNPIPVNEPVFTAVRTSGTQTQNSQMQTVQTGQAASQQPPPPPSRIPPTSPPREVFVAASVRQAPAPQSPAAQQSAVTQTPPQPAPTPQVRGVEARIAAAQAARAAPAAGRLPEKAPAAPLIPPRSPAAQAPPQSGAPRNIVQRIVHTVSEFLRAARLPDTAFTRTAATIAPHAAERLPSVLQWLEATLPRETQDARIPTLRTLIAFTARLNPANAETLRAQISAYVSNVIEGVEAKVAQLLQAHVEAGAQPHAGQASQTQKMLQPELPAAPGNTAPLPPALAQARVAERSAAIAYDLKSVVLSLLRDPLAQRTPAMTQALSEALITLTGVQVNALSANQQNPGTLTLTLPVYYHEGGKPAQLRISREGHSNGGKRMDSDNFHVAFVLDTANLGTVAVDLQSTGRAVKIEVKTETKPAAQRFSDTMDSLRTRLEDLRYRVASVAASALPPRAPAKNEPPVNEPAPALATNALDLRA
jgi:hypothetical protein